VEKRREAALSRKRLSKKGIARGDKDSKSRIDTARLTGKDAVPGKEARRLDRRHERAAEEAEGFGLKKRYDLGLWFESERARGDVLFSIPPGEIPLGADHALRFPELTAFPRDRISLRGPNGCGKSTLVRHIVDHAAVPRNRLIYLRQEMEASESAHILEEVRRLPSKDLGRVMTIINLLGSDPERLLSTGMPSPGESRKLLIAVGISRVPHLIILDEPTNHLDLPSIECLTEALGKCSCGLLLVSHDDGFLRDLSDIEWRINELDNDRELKYFQLRHT
jgi:macrolide transport system ATP-binding/permease protein